MLGLDLLDPLDEVGFFQAAVADLLPVVEDLLQLLHLQLLQVDALEVDLFLCKRKRTCLAVYQKANSSN